MVVFSFRNERHYLHKHTHTPYLLGNHDHVKGIVSLVKKVTHVFLIFIVALNGDIALSM